MLAADAFSGIGYIDHHLRGFIFNLNADAPFSFHSIQCILEQVFDHPIELGPVHHHGDLFFAMAVDAETYFISGPSFNIGHHLFYLM